MRRKDSSPRSVSESRRPFFSVRSATIPRRYSPVSLLQGGNPSWQASSLLARIGSEQVAPASYSVAGVAHPPWRVSIRPKLKSHLIST